ncbi:MAG: hypothetical protein GY778_30105, partial [bacterium]|nr:hypothetical protein [bacterium]
YRDRLSRESLGRAFIEAVGWTLSNMSDPHRRSEVTRHARACGLADLLADGDFQVLVARGSVTADNVDEKTQSFARRFGPAFVCDHFDTMVATALDIYYMRYHSLLRAIEQGQADRLGRELLGRPGRHLIEPMPGYEVFLPLIKGWLGPEVEALYELLRDHLLKRADLGYTAPGLDGFRPRLVRLAEHFRRHPVKVALVTASIAYETHASMKEVFRVLAKRIRDWPVTPACAEALAGRLADYRTVFDSVICAADACEHRLKPHRDLYSLALHEMSIPKGQYACCVGLEDTEPGIIALRAAGIGCAVALPNRDTSGQDYRAAAEIVPGGLPELILARNLLLAEEAPS